MAFSVVGIINSALAKVHEDPISSLDEDRRAARLAATQYPVHRDKLLRLYNWRFAMDRAVLAPDLTKPAFGFSNRFLLPTDCLRVVGVYDENDAYNQVNYTSGNIPFKIEGRYLLADSDAVKIYYVKQVTDPTKFDSLFAEALAWSLAIDFALSLANSPARADQARGEFRETIRQARLAAAIESGPEVIGGSYWLDSRMEDWTEPFRGDFV